MVATNKSNSSTPETCADRRPISQQQLLHQTYPVPGDIPGAAAPALRNPSELMRPLGQADRLVHEEANPILPQLVEPILESIDTIRYDRRV